MRRIKAVIGLLLISGAIIGLIYWELEGRERVLMQEVLVANEAILPGTLVTEKHFKKAKVLEENKVEGVLKPTNVNRIVGKVAVQGIVKNAQVVHEYFSKDNFKLEEEESIFVLKADWISMRSSSLRRGDWVDIYTDRGELLIGTYRVAYVKDGNEIEVRDSDKNGGRNFLERSDGSSIINSVEIISDLIGYQNILRQVIDNGLGIIVVQKGAAIDE